jgi:hypothetical protein
MVQVFVMVLPLGRQVTPEVETTDLVEALRRQITTLAAPLISATNATDRLSAAPTYQALYFDDRLLEDGTALADYGIAKDAELRAVLRPKPQVLRLDVGGMCSSLTADTIMAVPQSRLATMFEPVLYGSEPIEGDSIEVLAGAAAEGASDGAAGDSGQPAEGVPREEAPTLPQAPDGAYVIDRDAGSWRHVMNYLRARRPVYKNGVRTGSMAGEVVLPDSKAELRQLAVDANWYALDELEALARGQLQDLQQEQEDQIALIAEQQVPLGVSVQWSGAIDAIPNGWVQCDGANGTPDLRGKLLLGANDAHPAGKDPLYLVHSLACSIQHVASCLCWHWHVCGSRAWLYTVLHRMRLMVHGHVCVDVCSWLCVRLRW